MLISATDLTLFPFALLCFLFHFSFTFSSRLPSSLAFCPFVLKCEGKAGQAAGTEELQGIQTDTFLMEISGMPVLWFFPLLFPCWAWAVANGKHNKKWFAGFVSLHPCPHFQRILFLTCLQRAALTQKLLVNSEAFCLFFFATYRDLKHPKFLLEEYFHLGDCKP